MIKRLNRMAKLNRRNRRYRWPWGTGVWRLIENPGIGLLSEEFVEWASRQDDDQPYLGAGFTG